MSYDPAETLLDILAFSVDVLNVAISVESEARPSAQSMDTVDLDKLLLVRSPHRIYVGRVNVTKSGNQEKLAVATRTIESRFRAAKDRGHVADGDTFDVVLIQTTARPSEVAHLATWDAATTQFSFTQLNL